MIDLDLWEVATKPIHAKWRSVHDETLLLLNQNVLEAVGGVDLAQGERQ